MPEVPAQAYAWPPPEEVLAPQKARFAHKQAGNAKCKKKGEADPAETKKSKVSQGRVHVVRGKLQVEHLTKQTDRIKRLSYLRPMVLSDLSR